MYTHTHMHTQIHLYHVSLQEAPDLQHQPSPFPSSSYTSTYNVVFGGEAIHCGDERMPHYAGPGTDHYAPSKRKAEEMVLSWEGGASCSLRPAAIYGPGERRHFPRIAMVHKYTHIHTHM
jgi:nucleoside-diphosphate-sugar epimerase